MTGVVPNPLLKPQAEDVTVVMYGTETVPEPPLTIEGHVVEFEKMPLPVIVTLGLPFDLKSTPALPSETRAFPSNTGATYVPQEREVANTLLVICVIPIIGAK